MERKMKQNFFERKVTILKNCSFKNSSNKLSFSIYIIYISYKQEKIKFYRTTRESKCFHPWNQNFIRHDKNFLFLSFFFYLQKFAKRERRNIHKSDITRNQNGGKGPSITTTLELIRSRKLVTYLYLDPQSTSPFPPFLPFLPSFLRSFLFVDHGRD